MKPKSLCPVLKIVRLSIMRMFGGFSPAFFEEYHKHRPKSKPAGEYDMRQMLYELFHYVRVILSCGWTIRFDTDAHGVAS
jgi:fructosamine-3-kinase